MDESKNFSLIPEKVTRGPILFCCNYVTVDHIGMQIFKLLVLFVIIALHNVLTPHNSKTHLPIVSRTVRKLELN